MFGNGKGSEFVRGLNTSGRIGLFSLILLVSGVVLIGLGVFVFGISLKTGLIGWLACWIAGVIAHIGGEYPRGDFNFAARMAIQMVVRTVPPFGVALWGVKFAEPPLETSLVFYILSFYLIGLVVDVQLHLERLKAETIQSEQIGN